MTWESLGGKGIVNAAGERRLWAIECMDDLNREARYKAALVEAAIPLEALRMAGGTGITADIEHAVEVVRAALFNPTPTSDTGEVQGV